MTLVSDIQSTVDVLNSKTSFEVLNVEKIIASSLQIVDSESNKRIELFVDEGHSTVLVLDENGEESVTIVGDSAKNYIELSHKEDQYPRINIGDIDGKYAPIFYAGLVMMGEELDWFIPTIDTPVLFLSAELNNFLLQSILVDEGHSFFQVGPTSSSHTAFQASVANFNESATGLYSYKGGEGLGQITMEYSENDGTALVAVANHDTNFMTVMGNSDNKSGFAAVHAVPEDQDNDIFMGYDDTAYGNPPVLRVHVEDQITTEFIFNKSE